MYAKDLSCTFNSPEELGLRLMWEVRRPPPGCDIAKALDLIARGARSDIEDSEGRAPVLWAAKWGHAEILKALIEKRADLDQMDDTLNTALMWAAYNGKLEAAQILLAAGAKPDLQDYEGMTALMHVADGSCPGASQIAAALIDAGADLDIKNLYGTTALGIARSRCPEIAALMETTVEKRRQEAFEKSLAPLRDGLPYDVPARTLKIKKAM